jgi:hypothetical protein
MFSLQARTQAGRLAAGVTTCKSANDDSNSTAQGSHHPSHRWVRCRLRFTSAWRSSTTAGLHGDTVPARAFRSHRTASRPLAAAARTGSRTVQLGRKPDPSRRWATSHATRLSGCVARPTALSKLSAAKAPRRRLTRCASVGGCWRSARSGV